MTFELSVSSTGHLFHKFGISESDWYRIKQSIDSKCRTAWRRKQRGQSLAVKSFSKRTPRNSGGGKIQICLELLCMLKESDFVLMQPLCYLTAR